VGGTLRVKKSTRSAAIAPVALFVAALSILWPAALLAQQAPAADTTPKAAAKKKPSAKPTTAQLMALIEEQRALIERLQELILEQQAKIAEQQASIAAQEAEGAGQAASIEEQGRKLADLEASLAAMNARLDELVGKLPGEEYTKALEERLKRVEEQAQKVPELPPDVVSAGDFPGSIRIPGTDTAIKFGGRIRTAGVFTLDDLGSEDRFLTNSIPVEADDVAAGTGRRTTFSANTSRLNFEVRTPAGASQMRAFIEGDFFGSSGTEKRTDFRLRHAYAQYHGMIVGQTWSTFSDPAANHQALDFEGINGENLIRQAQFRYTWKVADDLSVAAAVETPEVSLTGGEGVNLMPDIVGRAIWTFKDIGHLQGAVVVRQIRGEWDVDPNQVSTVTGWGASLSGVVPFYYFDLTDRFIFQLNFGKGNARYINDLNSLGSQGIDQGQDGVFDPLTGDLHALRTVGWYLDYEHQWTEWKRTQEMKLRSSFIWSFVTVDNLDFQPGDAYHETNRYSANVVFSPIDRIDIGLEYIYGTRENKDGNRGAAAQVQIVGIFRF
jgi:outer membrane DcaP-like protein